MTPDYTDTYSMIKSLCKKCQTVIAQQLRPEVEKAITHGVSYSEFRPKAIKIVAQIHCCTCNKPQAFSGLNFITTSRSNT